METQRTTSVSWSAFLSVAMLAGIAIQLDWMAQTNYAAHTHRSLLLLQVVGGAAVFTVLLSLLRQGILWLLAHSTFSPLIKARYPHHDAWAYTPFLLTFLGGFGLVFSWQIIVLIFLLFIGANVLVMFFLKHETRQLALGSQEWLGFLFLLSGVAALMYQIIWQRVLFTIYGVNIESVTIIVSIFMFGLGIGSILGGVLSERFPNKLPMLFFVCELVIGAFGIISIPLIKFVGLKTQHLTLWGLSAVTFALLSIPTLMMGATLPILVTHINRRYQHVGKSVGILYFFNTLGSAFACFLTVELFFVLMGQQATTIAAAMFNFSVGFLVFNYMNQQPHATATTPPPSPPRPASQKSSTTDTHPATPKAAPPAAKAPAAKAPAQEPPPKEQASATPKKKKKKKKR